MKTWLILFFIICSIPLSSIDLNKPAIGLGSGVTIDIAPYGIEQLYITVQGVYILPGSLVLSLKPSISIANSSSMIRIPLLVNLSFYIDKNDFLLLSAYLGGGIEVYRSSDFNTNSPLLNGGISFIAGSFYIDIPIMRVLRSYTTDSDITITAGIYLNL